MQQLIKDVCLDIDKIIALLFNPATLVIFIKYTSRQRHIAYYCRQIRSGRWKKLRGFGLNSNNFKLAPLMRTLLEFANFVFELSRARRIGSTGVETTNRFLRSGSMGYSRLDHMIWERRGKICKAQEYIGTHLGQLLGQHGEEKLAWSEADEGGDCSMFWELFGVFRWFEGWKGIFSFGITCRVLHFFYTALIKCVMRSAECFPFLVWASLCMCLLYAFIFSHY